MKSLISFSVLLAMTGGINVANAAPTFPTKEITISVNDAFVPESVERGTDAKIVLSGMFPNSCYSWSRYEVQHMQDTKHQVKAMANVTINAMCLMVLVPYSKEVNLGKLSPGDHTLKFLNGDDTYFEKTLTVK